MSRIQGGDHSHVGIAEFEELFARHFDAVYGYLRAMLGTPADAEEAAHEVFERAFHAGQTHPHDVRPWLFSIARAAVVARGCSRDGALAARTSDPELMRLIEELPDLEREVVILRYLVGLSGGETASSTGRSRIAVARAHRRALRTLQHRSRRDRTDARVPVLTGASPG